MSIITIVRKADSVALCADTLTKYGRAKESAEYIGNPEKIISMGDTHLGICGPTSAKLAIKHYIANQSKPLKFENVESIFSEWLRLHVALTEQYFMRPIEDEDDSFESTRIDVLIANPSGAFAVSAHRSVQEITKFYAFGAGIKYAMGEMFAVYDNPDFSALKIAEIGVRAAIEFDDSAGFPLTSRVARLTTQK